MAILCTSDLMVCNPSALKQWSKENVTYKLQSLHLSQSFPCFSLLLWVDTGAKVSCSPATQPQGGALAPLVLEPNPGSWSFLELAQLKEAETVEAGGSGEGFNKRLRLANNKPRSGARMWAVLHGSCPIRNSQNKLFLTCCLAGFLSHFSCVRLFVTLWTVAC